MSRKIKSKIEAPAEGAGPMRELCWAQDVDQPPHLMSLCDREKGHPGRHSWEPDTCSTCRFVVRTPTGKSQCINKKLTMFDFAMPADFAAKWGCKFHETKKMRERRKQPREGA